MMIRRLTLFLFLLGSTLTPVRAQQSDGAQIQVSTFFGGTAKAGYWVPVNVTVANDGPDRDAVIRIGTNVSGTYDAPIELPRGARKSLVMYVRPQGFTRTIQARLVDGEQELAATKLSFTPMPATAQIIGLLLEQPLAAPLPVPASPQIKQATPLITQQDIPARVEGLALFDALLMDQQAFEGLQPEQVAALDDWVQSGGQIVLSVGHDPAAASALPPVFQIGTAAPLADHAVADSILHELGAGSQIRAAALTPTGASRALDTMAVQRQWGRGRITMVGWSWSDPALQRLPRGTTLWGEFVQWTRSDPNLQGDMSVDSIQEQQFAQALHNLPALQLPPLNVLAALLAVYILLVGPGLFFLLRRLDRQALGWVLIPAITVVFSLGTYGYGLSIRGNDVILNEISFIQPLGDRARVRTFAGIFSPIDQSYDVSAGQDILTRPVQVNGAMWGGQPGQNGSTGHFVQGSGEVRDLQVAQWSMTTFAAETRMPYQTLTAQLELGERVLRGTVRNIGTEAVRDAAIIYGSRALVVGNLVPGASKNVEFQVNNMGSAGTGVAMMIFKDRWNMQMGPPPELRMPVQLIDSLYSYGPITTRSTKPIVIGWIDKSPLQFTTNVPRMHTQQLTLVEAQAELSYASDVAFPRGLFWPEFTTGGANNSCTTQWGSGVVVDSNTITATLRLPEAARDLAVTKATLYPQIEGQPPQRVLSEVFDWQADAWKPQSEKLATFDLSDPARFFRDGAMRMRMSIPAAGLRGGCLVIDSSIEGTR